MSDHKLPQHPEGEQWFHLSLSEVVTSFGVSREMILEIIDEGIVSAQYDEQRQLQFDTEAIRRIKTVIRLNQDLGINLPGAGLALELLQELDELRALLNKVNYQD